jgi:hypothetical protein
MLEIAVEARARYLRMVPLDDSGTLTAGRVRIDGVVT